jgi:3-methyl-2-oxobutanoate hydroxymethyltransferase
MLKEQSMSSAPRPRVPEPPARKRVTLTKLAEMRDLGEPIVMVTAYDHPSAVAVEAAGVDVVLVGDSAANNVLGYEDTVPVTVEELLMLAAAVRRGLRTPLLVGDLPFGSYEASDAQAIATAHRFVKEAGVDAVKLEGGGASAERARAIVRAGVPVMGHVGLTPQTATALGGYRAQGRTAARARQVLEDAVALQRAGCFAVVFEAIPAEVTDVIMGHMEIPVIGIGAGPSTDGQVLVLHDLLGIHDGFQPKFVKRYAQVKQVMVQGLEAYADDVRARRFPGPEHTYGIAPEELDRLRAQLPRAPRTTA